MKRREVFSLVVVIAAVHHDFLVIVVWEEVVVLKLGEIVAGKFIIREAVKDGGLSPSLIADLEHVNREGVDGFALREVFIRAIET